MRHEHLKLLDEEVLIRKNKIFSKPISTDVHILQAKRNYFLNWIYEVGLVEATSYSAHCADKLFFSQLLERFAPEANYFHPKTIALSWAPKNIVELKSVLQKEFPSGFIVKQTGGINSDKVGVYLNEEDFFSDFQSSPELFELDKLAPAASTGLISSGEKFIVQEKIRGLMELRLHTLGERVVSGATYTRWNEPWDKELFLMAENSVQVFLSKVPKFLLQAQAWSLDVLWNGSEFRLIEVNTNRGKEHHWSGDLIIPETLGAYVRHLEKYYGLNFVGEVGEAFRTNKANREKYLLKAGEKEVLLHEQLSSQSASDIVAGLQ